MFAGSIIRTSPNVASSRTPPRFGSSPWAPPIGAGSSFAHPSDASASDRFGRSVAVDGNVIVVGADWDDAPAFDSGSAYLFRNQGVNCGWVQDHQFINRSAAGYDYLGTSVAIGGGNVLVGSHLDDTAGGYDAGSVNVYSSAEVTLDISPKSVGAGQNVTLVENCSR